MARRLTQRGKERRDQLMAFAAARFAEQGYHPTSVGEIVAGLGVGKGVFYWYFDSKEQLFLEILKEAQTDLRRRQQQAIGDEEDPIRRIELGLRASMAWAEAHRDHNKLIQFAATETTFIARPAPRPGHRRRRRREARQGGDRRRAASATPTPTCSPTPWSAWSATSRASSSTSGASPPTSVADAAVAFCLEGLSPATRAASPSFVEAPS